MRRLPKGIVVTTFSGSPWLKECLEHLKGLDYKVWKNTKKNNWYEAGGIRYGYKHFDEFWLIPDTVMVKRPQALLDALDDVGTTYTAGPNYISCIGKFRSEIIDKIGLPAMPKSKWDAVIVEVDWLHRVYREAEPNLKVMDWKFTDGDKFEYKHGRTNMILENDTFKKYKGTWSPDMIRD